jgi:hypothetical protein
LERGRHHRIMAPSYAFPAKSSLFFEFHGLDSWVILSLGLYHLFLGLTPVQ